MQADLLNERAERSAPAPSAADGRARAPALRMAALGFVAIVAGWTATRAYRSWNRTSDGRLEPIAIASPASYWSRNGFIELVTPLRAPSNADGTDHTTVWLKLPNGGRIQTLRLSDGRTSLVFPGGTAADRVESIGDAVVDVRGTRLDEKGAQWFRVLRSEAAGSGDGLAGYEWMRGDDDTGRAIAGVLTARLRQTYGARAGERFGTLMECARCHPTNKVANRRPAEAGLPNRPTDGSGFYQILAVLSDESPVELYRPRELNVDDPFVRFRCGDGAAAGVLRKPNGETRVTCSDGTVPVGRLDLPAALRAGDERARGVCRARAALAEHLDETGRQEFSSALRECAASS